MEQPIAQAATTVTNCNSLAQVGLTDFVGMASIDAAVVTLDNTEIPYSELRYGPIFDTASGFSAGMLKVGRSLLT